MKAICLLSSLLVFAACGPSPRQLTPTATITQTLAYTPPNTPTVPSDEPTLVFFTSEPGRFQAWLPVSGSIEEYTITKTLFGQPVDCSVIASGLNSAYAIVQYCDLIPESIASLSSRAFLDQARSELVRDFNLKSDTEQGTLIENAYPTLLFSGQAAMRGFSYDGVFKARIILAEDRIYLVVMTVHTDNWCNCLHQVGQVVESFRVAPDLSIPFEPMP